MEIIKVRTSGLCNVLHFPSTMLRRKIYTTDVVKCELKTFNNLNSILYLFIKDNINDNKLTDNKTN